MITQSGISGTNRVYPVTFFNSSAAKLKMTSSSVGVNGKFSIGLLISYSTKVDAIFCPSRKAGLLSFTTGLGAPALTDVKVIFLDVRITFLYQVCKMCTDEAGTASDNIIHCLTILNDYLRFLFTLPR